MRGSLHWLLMRMVFSVMFSMVKSLRVGMEGGGAETAGLEVEDAMVGGGVVCVGGE